jgi:hypothetical protein
LEGQTCLLSGGAPDSHCSCPVRNLLPFLVHPTVGPGGQLAHRTLSGAHRTVRCPLPTVGASHASPADCAVDHCAGDRWLTGQSGVPPDSPVNYSRTPLIFSRERPFHRRLAWRTGHCPVCQTELSFGCIEPSPFWFLFFLFSHCF